MRRDVVQAARHYERLSVGITLVTALAVIGLVMLTGGACVSVALIAVGVSVLFSLLVSVAYGEAWVSVARCAPLHLSKFYLAASVLRMTVALAVAMVGALAFRPDRYAVVCFLLIFVTFYVVLLVFDCIYFVQILKNERA